MEGKEGQERFKPALPPKAANTVTTALLQLICKGPSSLKTKPTPLLSWFALGKERHRQCPSARAFPLQITFTLWHFTACWVSAETRQSRQP